MRAICGCSLVLSLGFSVPAVATQPQATSQQRPLDVIYVPTPPDVVAKMLSLAGVGPGDVVYDLGSGDGRIVISAVRDFSAARGTGIDLDPQRNAEAAENARVSGVSDRVQFVAQDLFEADLSAATVVTLYLLPSVNARLAPKLRALKPGTRIVSHNYDLSPDWKPEAKVNIGRSLVYFWIVPPP